MKSVALDVRASKTVPCYPPQRILGRVIRPCRQNNSFYTCTLCYFVTACSLALHQKRKLSRHFLITEATPPFHRCSCDPFLCKPAVDPGNISQQVTFKPNTRLRPSLKFCSTSTVGAFRNLYRFFIDTGVNWLH